jgi:hypothetical protein
VPDLPVTASDGTSTRLHALLGGGRFVWLSVGVAAPQLPAALQRIAITASAAEAEGYATGHHYLVRPDGYLSLSAKGDDPQTIVGWLQPLSSAG